MYQDEYHYPLPEPRTLTDAQYEAIAARFVGRNMALATILAELGIEGDSELIETELWVDGFKQCPGCGLWHQNLWHSHCDPCYRGGRASHDEESRLVEVWVK